jgi:hypothetical protein
LARNVHSAIFAVSAAAWLVLGLAALGMAGALPGPLAAVAAFLTSCPYEALTSRPCPLCGVTTAAIALLHGDLEASLSLNPLALALATLAVSQPPYRLFRTLRPKLSLYEEALVTGTGVAIAVLVLALA